MCNFDEIFQNDFITTIQKRGAAVIAARKMSSAMSAAKAATDHMHDWYAHNFSDFFFVYLPSFLGFWFIYRFL